MKLVAAADDDDDENGEHFVAASVAASAAAAAFAETLPVGAADVNDTTAAAVVTVGMMITMSSLS